MAPKGLQQSIENHLLINEEFNGCVTLSLVIEYASAKKSANGPLAQLVEQLTLNQRVAGSSPSRITIENESTVRNDCAFCFIWPRESRR